MPGTPGAYRLLDRGNATHTVQPYGDGRGDSWRLEFNTSKPLTAVVLTVRNSTGRTVETLKGNAPDGSIRDVRWNGKTQTGGKAATGTYTWELSAKAADGEGKLIGVDGGAITGRVALSR
ncbi:hypothetical protein Kisp01_41910 [Kineosporia sp. NBRC 101677]|uniref:FlgD immunoglobulin-like domain containing protein n=1 Tax=Kineosporia sp. NBRC 101677 TaxID=3032197 RepID=UPI0024A3FE9E|nr:FlgD immunoglobulin-like domain containing protein [Kineosporia sp. NBRC 101677]GLY17176.1 hypothetical protein Kisp01_41910 [Kineosporia sp. NBRC 101677]